jgi:hypothetical protein
VGPFQSAEDWEMLLCNDVLEDRIFGLEAAPQLLAARGISWPGQLFEMGDAAVAELLCCTDKTAAKVRRRCAYYGGARWCGVPSHLSHVVATDLP